MSQLTVYYDGACPLCRNEIAFLRKLDRKERIRFLDVSPPDAGAYCPLPKAQLLSRFHVMRSDGKIVEGAEAFTELYSVFPLLIWLRPIGRFPPTRWLLDRLYDGFLVLRPHLQKWAGAKA